jgi:hypothetical protein
MYSLGKRVDQKQIEDWAKNLTEEVDRKWEASAKEALGECGYAVFYSPVRMRPDLMIIGFNPGGRKDSFNRDEAKSIPNQHEYRTYRNEQTYPIAGKMYKLFEDLKNVRLLEQSVKTNIIFFRTKDEKQWKSLEHGMKSKLEAFCMKKVKEIVETLEPRLIFTEGFQAFDRLKRTLLLSEKKPVVSEGKRKRRIVHRANNEAYRLFGMRHPTGQWSRPSEEEWKVIKRQLEEEVRALSPGSK